MLMQQWRQVRPNSGGHDVYLEEKDKKRSSVSSMHICGVFLLLLFFDLNVLNTLPK